MVLGQYWVVLFITLWYWVNNGWDCSLLGGTESEFIGSGWYLVMPGGSGWCMVVLGQYGAVLVGTWWYWISIRQ